jgi:hypothetical protein
MNKERLIRKLIRTIGRLVSFIFKDCDCIERRKVDSSIHFTKGELSGVNKPTSRSFSLSRETTGSVKLNDCSLSMRMASLRTYLVKILSNGREDETLNSREWALSTSLQVVKG